MLGRFWFYMSALIIISGLGSYLSWITTRQSNELAAIEQAATTDRQESINRFLARQTDGRKLITLAKNLQKTEPELVRPIILRAYELLPNSRDAAILASYYRPELKEKIKELDPLYQE